MKKITHLLVLLMILQSQLGVLPAQASGSLEMASLQEGQLPNIFTLSQLGYNGTMMVGPYDSSSVYFSLPANTRLAPGSSLTLKYALAWSGNNVPETELPGVGGSLLVYFNDELIDTIILTPTTPLEKEIPIPDSALNIPDESGRYNLRFFLSADINCDMNVGLTTLIVDKTSRLNFQYNLVSPVADLTLFPRPIYQPDSILPNSALIVVPDNPEAFELQAAIAAMTGIGSVTAGKLNIRLITNSLLSQGLVGTNHLIFIGLAKGFPSLQVVEFPVPLSDGRLQIGDEYETDGIIETALSPWNTANVVMYVGGNSQEAVVKAGQALSTGKIVAVEKPGLSLIKNVNPLVHVPSQEDQTLKDLGYEDTTLGVYGEYYADYTFYASAEQAASEGAYVDIVLSHSDLIDFDQTGLSVILNDDVVGGLKLSKENPDVQQIKLVPGILRRGFNRLEIVSDIRPHYDCYSEDLLSTSITISNTSLLHLPVTTTQIDFGKNVNLYDFPYMFLDSRDLSNLAFVLAPNDPISWNYAALAAFTIGANGNVPFADISAVYADGVPEEILKESHLLVFGLPNAVPFFSEINDKLPAPFDPVTNEAIQPSMLVNYSLLPGTNVGYLQLLPSLWNPDRTILVVSGNTLDGLPMAGSVLLTDSQVAKLLGNFAVIYSEQIVSTDTRLGPAKESIISQLPVSVTATPSVAIELPQISSSQIESRPAWIPPLVGAVTVVALILLLVMLRKESSTGKISKKGIAREENPADPTMKSS